MTGINTEEHMDKQNFMDDVIDNFFAGYSKLLACQLMDEGYVTQTYEEPENTIKICEIAINCIINTFEKVVSMLLTSLKDVQEFIHIYSSFSNPTSKKPIIFRHTCRYIFAILPKLKLTSAPSANSDEHNMLELCKLIALTKLLHTFIQARSIQIIENTSCLKIILDSFVSVDYTSSNIIALNKKLNDSTKLIHKSFASEDDFQSLMKTLENNSIALKTLLDYTSQLIDRRGDIFEVTREVVNCNGDPIIQGITFSIDNVNFREAIHSPYNTNFRTRFRPILQLNIDGAARYFSTPWMIVESMDEISTNLLPYGELPKGWEKIHDLKLLCKEVSRKAGSIFEDEVFKVIDPKYMVKRNITGFHTVSLKKQKVPNTNRKVGEIDFILIDKIRKIIFVIDAKCTKTKFYFQSFTKDKSTFEEYSIKLNDKVDWITSHKSDVGKFFKIRDISEYTVEGLFVTNSLIYYNFFSQFPIVPLDKVLCYIESLDRMCVIS